MSDGALKVGELARRTGLTVRTLHHYDAIGLLRPSSVTSAGHRLYTGRDFERLQRIRALRNFGFSLEEIRDCLDRPGFSPLEVVRLHVGRLREQIDRQEELCRQLETLARLLESSGEAPAEQFLRTIESMTMSEQYYTPEQLAAIKKRGEEYGEEAIRAVEQEWPVLIGKMKAEMDAGTDPADPGVQALAARWKELVEAFTGGDPGITQSLSKMWKDKGPELAQRSGFQFDPKLFEYVGKAQAILKQGS